MTEAFYNRSLQKTHSKIEKSISNHLQKLDELSNDIKQLEKVLAKAALSVDYEYLIDQSPVFKKTNATYNSYLLQTNYLIVWRKEKNRLMYETHDIYFHIDDTNLSNPSNPNIKISKPLIECRSHIRLKIEPELDFFYQGIDSILGQGFLQETFRISSPILIAKKAPAVEGEIPF